MGRDMQASETSEELRHPAVSAGRKRQLVLAVEDERHDWAIYGKLLWYNGFDVLWAESGEDGVRLAEEHEPDVVLADLMLPGMSGIEMCEALKANASTRHIPVIMLTARSRREYGARALDAGCERYLEKPIGPLSVLHIVEDLVGRPPPPGE
ncbi:MAG: response regulator [Gemmatimonadetes bacterium]|nr:response regulator [Gemmatimonadota bacterium]